MTPEQSPTPDSDYVLVSRAGLAKIASAYDDWNPDGNFASTCLAQAARAAKELLATARPTPADDAERQEGTAAKIADLKKLSSKATLGSWLHYDKVFRRQFGNGRVTEIQRYGDGKAIINWGGFDGLPDMTARKRNHNARFIVELVNFFRKHADNLLALQPRETDARMREHLRAALDHYERNICHHEETHRGGFLWTICDSCGAKWADDEGGFKPFEYPPEIVAARAALEADRGASNA